jgi:hypothetical protein
VSKLAKQLEENVKVVSDGQKQQQKAQVEASKPEPKAEPTQAQPLTVVVNVDGGGGETDFEIARDAQGTMTGVKKKAAKKPAKAKA